MHKLSRKAFKCFLPLLLLFLLLTQTACTVRGMFPGPEGGAKRYEAEFLDLFDTYTKIVAYTDDEAKFREQVQFIYDELLIYHQLYDIYNDYDGVNNIRKINDNAGIAPVKVDARILDLLEFCQKAYDMTNHKVNVAFGSVLSIWHDYREAGMDDPENAQLPPMEQLRAAASHTDMSQMILDRPNSTVYLADPEMRLDVGAIAKGFAVEAVSREAREKMQVTSMLISVGGNVSAIGTKDGSPDGEKWSVGIQNPDKGLADQPDTLETVLISDMSLVTSGDYQRYYTVDGVQYNHIIDCDTLMPASHYRAVTILCPDSGLADTLSTAAFLMNQDSGTSLIQSISGAEALYVMKDGSTMSTDGFSALVK